MRSISSPVRRTLAALAAAPLVLAAAACGGDDAANADPGTDGGSSTGATADELRLGYFANVTHAPAVLGVQEGFFEKELGDTELKTQVFNAGPDVVEALFAGALDASYIGPSPTINAYGQSEGDAVRIIAGAASGGAQLVVREGIESPEDLKGTTLATPQLGNTQDVALRAWLDEEGLESSIEGGGDVTITPTPNADTLNLFKSGDVDGAWLPEPWASRLVLEAGAKVLVDERDLWPDGEFVTTQLVVRTEFLDKYPGTVAALLRGHVAAVQFANDDAEAAKASFNEGMVAAGSDEVPADVLDRAWEGLTATYDPIASALKKSAADGFKAGTTETEVDLDGIYDLRLLNEALADLDLEPVSAGGLGKD
jgi:NitT/TauT family transport system substrate-binding protein